MFNNVWPIMQKELATANAAWDTAKDFHKRSQDNILIAEHKLELVLASLDEVVKQCTGKPGKFTPVMDGERMAGMRVDYEAAGITVTTTLDLDAPPDTQ